MVNLKFIKWLDLHLLSLTVFFPFTFLVHDMLNIWCVNYCVSLKEYKTELGKHSLLGTSLTVQAHSYTKK